jgi:hypothetical protein
MPTSSTVSTSPQPVFASSRIVHSMSGSPQIEIDEGHAAKLTAGLSRVPHQGCPSAPGFYCSHLRAALDWALSLGGDGSIGVALTTAAVPLWMRPSLLQERGGRAKQALGGLETEGTRDPREEMRLPAALGDSTADAPEMGAAFTKVLDIAESPGDSEYQLRAFHGLCFCHTDGGRYRAALQCAQKLHDLATSGSGPSDRLFGERIVGTVEHFSGDQKSVRRHLEQVLTHSAPAIRDGMSFASRLTCKSRRARSLRGRCGCTGFQIRRCTLPK